MVTVVNISRADFISCWSYFVEDLVPNRQLLQKVENLLEIVDGQLSIIDYWREPPYECFQ